MTTINLKDFYAWYTHDEYVEVPNEVAEELKADIVMETRKGVAVRYASAI